MNTPDDIQDQEAQELAEARSLVIRKVQASLRRRHFGEKIFHGLGIGATVLGLAFVAILFINIFSKGLPAFWQTAITLDIYFDPEVVDIAEAPERLKGESSNDSASAVCSGSEVAWSTSTA